MPRSQLMEHNGVPTSPNSKHQPQFGEENISPIAVSSERDVQVELEKIGEVLSNKKVLWSKRVDAMKQFQGLVYGGAHQFNNFAPLASNYKDQFAAQLSDLRSAVVKEACNAIACWAKAVGDAFNVIVEVFIPPLFKLTCITKQVMSESAHTCMTNIIKNCRLKKCIPRIIEGTSAKHNSMRFHCMEYVRLMLESYPTSFIDPYLEMFEKTIKTGIMDSQPDTRSKARCCYWCLHRHYPERSKKLYASFDKSIQKAINNENHSENTERPSSSSSSSSTSSLQSSFGSQSSHSSNSQRLTSSQSQKHHRTLSHQFPNKPQSSSTISSSANNEHLPNTINNSRKKIISQAFNHTIPQISSHRNNNDMIHNVKNKISLKEHQKVDEDIEEDGDITMTDVEPTVKLSSPSNGKYQIQQPKIISHQRALSYSEKHKQQHKIQLPPQQYHQNSHYQQQHHHHHHHHHQQEHQTQETQFQQQEKQNQQQQQVTRLHQEKQLPTNVFSQKPQPQQQRPQSQNQFQTKIPKKQPSLSVPIQSYPEKDQVGGEDEDIPSILNDLNGKAFMKKEGIKKLRSLSKKQEEEIWVQYFANVLFAVFELLVDSEERIREDSLLLLNELLKYQSSHFDNFAPLTLKRILEMYGDTCKRVSLTAETVASTYVEQIDSLRTLEVLCPLIMNEIEISVLASIQLLSKVVIRIPSDTLLSKINLILPGLFEQFKHPNPDIRKAVVYCLVDIYMVLGESFKPYLAQLNMSQLKLVTICKSMIFYIISKIEIKKLTKFINSRPSIIEFLQQQI